MAVRGQDIASVIKHQIEEFGQELTMVDVGTVVPEPSIFAFVALLAIPALYRHRRRARDS